MGLSHFRFDTCFLWYFIDSCIRRERIVGVKLSIFYLPKFFAKQNHFLSTHVHNYNLLSAQKNNNSAYSK